MEQVFDDLTSADKEKAAKALQSFVESASTVFTFPQLTKAELRAKIWNVIFNIAETETSTEILINCFSAIRILSREKALLNELITEEWFDLLKQYSGIGNEKFIFDGDKGLIAVEVQKAMCNIIFNCSVAAAMCCKNGIIEGITNRIKHYKSNIIPEEVQFFDMKLLFLITALCPEVRYKLKEELHGISSLINVLELVLQHAADANNPGNLVTLTDKQVDLVCEVLKTFFNITVGINNGDEEEYQQCVKLVSVLKLYILISVKDKEKKFALHRNIIHLLTNMPTGTFVNLMSPIQPGQDLYIYEDQNMLVFQEMLLFAQNTFSDDPGVSKQNELISPIISVLLKSANADRKIRKYLRLQILPPLKDVHKRPEEGTTIRNHLCRLLTTPVTQVKYLVAELLFVLCKKNVNRLIKYTGYGNSAGLFMEKGLLGLKKHEGEADYSSDSGESETEEYAKYKHGINPVIGCYEEPHANPMENMSEEQKEYEAMKLVELMDKLTKMGTIQPCRVGPDGKAQPIQHVLQLQEGLRAQQIHNNEDSDSN